MLYQIYISNLFLLLYKPRLYILKDLLKIGKSALIRSVVNQCLNIQISLSVSVLTTDRHKSCNIASKAVSVVVSNKRDDNWCALNYAGPWRQLVRACSKNCTLHLWKDDTGALLYAHILIHRACLEFLLSTWNDSNLAAFTICRKEEGLKKLHDNMYMQSNFLYRYQHWLWRYDSGTSADGKGLLFKTYLGAGKASSSSSVCKQPSK